MKQKLLQEKKKPKMSKEKDSRSKKLHYEKRKEPWPTEIIEELHGEKEKIYDTLFAIFPRSSIQKNVVGASGILAICIFLGSGLEAWRLREADSLCQMHGNILAKWLRESWEHHSTSFIVI